MTRTVALYGFAPETRDLIHNVSGDTEIWSVNWAYRYDIPRIDRLFDVHLPEILRAEKIREYREHWEWLQEPHDFPIYMIERMPEVPASVAYPVDELSNDIFRHMITGPNDDPDDYWVSGISYALGMAIHERPDRIELYGCEMRKTSEVMYQRDGMALLCGIAMGRGIDVWRPEGSDFLSAKRYGFEASQMVSRASLEEHLSHYKIDEGLITGELNKVNGVVGERQRIVEQEKNIVKKKDAIQLLQNAQKRFKDLEGQLERTVGAMQAVEHLLAVADLQEPSLELKNEIGLMEVKKV